MKFSAKKLTRSPKKTPRRFSLIEKQKTAVYGGSEARTSERRVHKRGKLDLVPDTPLDKQNLFTGRRFVYLFLAL